MVDTLKYRIEKLARKVSELMKKFNPNQPRDNRGRWSSGGTGSTSSSKPKLLKTVTSPIVGPASQEKPEYEYEIRVKSNSEGTLVTHWKPADGYVIKHPHEDYLLEKDPDPKEKFKLFFGDSEHGEELLAKDVTPAEAITMLEAYAKKHKIDGEEDAYNTDYSRGGYIEDAQGNNYYRTVDKKWGYEERWWGLKPNEKFSWQK